MAVLKYGKEQTMPRTAASVTQADIARALRAVAQTGATVAVEVLRDGTIRLVPCEKREITDNMVKAKVDNKPVLLLS
jgi:hypothetical protein